MANTIKLKRGSGSDPSASDLSVGEIAIRTDSGKLFTKKDNGSVAEISGSGGIDDGDKGDITVSNSGATFTIDNGVVTSAKITDGTIVNADINASAAIDGSKIQAAGLFNQGVMTAAQNNKLAGIEDNATGDMTATEVLSLISGDNIILGEISSTGNSTFAGNITISSSDGGSAAAPELDLNRDSASPAASDYLGQIKFTGESVDGSKEVYAKITGKIGDASSGSEDGILEIAHRKAGSNNISARFTSTDLKLINGTGLEVAGDTTLSGDLTINSALPKITFTDSDGNPDYLIQVNGGQWTLRDVTNSSNIMRINPASTSVDNTLNATSGINVTSGGLDVTGNIAVSGTVDGRDLATDGSKLDGIETGAINSSNTAITNKMPLAGGEFTGNVISHNITPDTDSSRFLGSNGTRFSKVFADVYEGSGANLTNLPSQTDNNFTDALLSKLNGIAASATNVTNNNQLTNGAGYITATLTNEQVQDIVGGMVTGNTETGITVTYQDGDGTLDFVVGTLNQDTTGNAATATALETARTIAGVSFDGSANISLNNNAITNGAGYITSSNSAITNKLPLAGGTLTGNLTIQNGNPEIIFQDTGNNPDFKIENADGVFVIRDTSNSTDRLTVASDGAITASTSLTSPRISGSNGIMEMKAEIGTSVTLTTGYNAIAVDPTVASGVTVTVPSGATWSIV